MILVAPTAFKGTHSAAAVAHAMARAAGARQHELAIQPVSDGGPGLIDTLSFSKSANIQHADVTGPLGTSVRARILLDGKRAIVESADACGLHLLSEAQRNPLLATTFGVGELLIAASNYASEIIVGLGGSATVDGGVGMARALGYHFSDAQDRELVGSEALLQAARIGGSSALNARVVALADVRSPLTGTDGAARVFGPQKGANPDDVAVLDDALARLGALLERDLNVAVASLPGGGAAGGLGAGLHAFARAMLVPGAEWVLRAIDADALIARAQLLITGEGCYDAQSSLGKITGELIARAGNAGVPVLLVAGKVEGSLPAHVRAAAADGYLSLADIEQIVREALPMALAAR